MTPQLTRHLSITAGLIFAAWVVWLWVDPMKPEQVQQPVVQKPQEMAQKPQVQQPAQPSVLVLPAPPAPALTLTPTPTPTPTPQPVAKVEAPKPVVQKVVEKPKPVPVVQKQEKPVAPQKKPSPKPAPEPKPEPKVHEASQEEAVGGRTLLKVLEHGKGPQIEIAWPKNARVRDGLYEKFQSCFGMENALMDSAGNLFRHEDPRGQRWEINLDRFSGFLRQASGHLPQKEERIMDSISRHHGHLSQPVPVRIFPRRVDASLLGGLKAVIGENYMAARSIQARYDSNGIVQDIHIDGRLINGRVKMAQFKRCSWRV